MKVFSKKFLRGGGRNFSEKEMDERMNVLFFMRHETMIWIVNNGFQINEATTRHETAISSDGRTAC